MRTTDGADGGSSGGLGRRDFLRTGALAGLGASLLPLAASAVPEEPRVRRHVRLGRTGLRVCDIGFGSSRLDGDEALVRHALERGIDYFDTAESYRDGRSEETLGRVLPPHRDAVTLVSKIQAGADESHASLMRRLEGSLRRLRTDRVEVCFNHAVNDVDRLRNPEWGEFAERAKQQGKIRFTGMSGHGGRLAECALHAIEHDLADVLLLGFNYGQDPAFHQRFTAGFDFVAVQPELPRVIERAKQKDVGVVAMKTLRGARLNDLRPYEGGGATFAQAAFRWVLSHANVDSLVVTMKSPAMIDEYLGASGWRSAHADDARLLVDYERRNGASQCRYGCDACTGSCPHAVPIPDVLRARMYAEDYEDPEQGRETYAALGAGAVACLSCAHRACADACPYGVTIPELTGRAHRRLGAPSAGQEGP